MSNLIAITWWIHFTKILKNKLFLWVIFSYILYYKDKTLLSQEESFNLKKTKKTLKKLILKIMIKKYK